jgi:antitoxin component YwqK of YwqJK toxin-antitoxin module
MKNKFLTFILTIISSTSIAQVNLSVKKFFDSNWNQVDEGEYTYYQIIKEYNLEKTTYEVFYYYKSGVLHSKGMTSDKDYLHKEGTFISYYENGNKKKLVNYIKGVETGFLFKWYPNGSKKEEGEYVEYDSKKKLYEYKVKHFWDAQGVQKVIDGNGDLEENENNNVATGKIKDGFKDGVWTGIGNDKSTFIESYTDKKLISGTSIDANKVSYNYTALFVKPEPKGGIKNFYKYIGNNFKTPEFAKNYNGKVVVHFIVSKDGKISKTKILKHFGYGVDEEALRVVSNSENWKPGEIRGIPTNCSYSLPIVISNSY